MRVLNQTLEMAIGQRSAHQHRGERRRKHPVPVSRLVQTLAGLHQPLRVRPLQELSRRTSSAPSPAEFQNSTLSRTILIVRALVFSKVRKGFTRVGEGNTLTFRLTRHALSISGFYLRAIGSSISIGLAFIPHDAAARVRIDPPALSKCTKGRQLKRNDR